MFCENCGKEIKDENKFCPYCGASVQPEQNGEQPEQSAQPEQKSEQPEQSAQPEQKNEQPKQSAQPEQKSEQPKQSAQSDQRLTQKETTGNSSADVKNKGVSHPAPKKKKTAVVIGIIAMAAVIIIGIIAAVKMFGSSDAKETAKDSTYKEVKENAAEKESKPAKKENVKPKKETDGEMKKDSGQEEKKEEKDNSKREAVLTDPVTMGWAGTYKDDDSGDRLVIASIGYEWSYVIYTSSGQIFEKESECGAFGDYLEGQYYTFYKNENGLLSVTSGAGKGWGNYRRISGTYTPDLEIEGTYENDTTTMIVYDQMAEASTKYVPTGSDIAAVRVEYNNGLVIDGRLYTQGDGGLSIIDSVSKEINGIATFENGEVKVTGSGFDGILKSK